MVAGGGINGQATCTDTGIFRLIGLPWRIVRRHRISC